MPFPLDNRIFVLFDASYYQDHDTYIHLAFDAVNFDHQTPKGKTKATCDLMGTILKRAGPNRTHYINFSRTTPNISNMPAFILKSTTKDLAMSGLKVKQEAEKPSR